MHIQRAECWPIILVVSALMTRICKCAEILMITMGGTKSHKIPFLELGKGLYSRGHNITFINAFPPSKPVEGILEITPPGLVFYVRNYTNWDLLGSRLRGEEPLSPADAFRYGFQVGRVKSSIKTISTKNLKKKQAKESQRKVLVGVEVRGYSHGQGQLKSGSINDSQTFAFSELLYRSTRISASLIRLLFGVLLLYGFRVTKPIHHFPSFDITVQTNFKVCDQFLGDFETRQLINSGNKYDLMILDGAFPECALGLAHLFKVPYIYINTVGLYMGSISTSGSPVPWSITPFFGRSLTDDMSLFERLKNTGYMFVLTFLHYLSTKLFIQNVVRAHLGSSVPDLFELTSNVSFVIQIGHHSVTYPRPYLPNVLEAGCLHCKPAKPLPKDLEDFINLGNERGFILMSMGSSVRTFNFPEYLRLLFIQVFSQLPYQVLWKWDEDDMPNLPKNVKLGRWLPQQDLLGHPKIRAFVTHGGLLSMLETVFHGVPIVTMPVFCDHEADARKAELDGYAIKLDVAELTPEKLLWALKTVIQEPKYKEKARQRSVYLRDVPTSPIRSAIYWTEYVLRHKGAPHLKSPSRNLSVIQYYLIDVVFIYFVSFVLFLFLTFTFSKYFFRLLYSVHLKSVFLEFSREKLKQS